MRCVRRLSRAWESVCVAAVTVGTDVCVSVRSLILFVLNSDWFLFSSEHFSSFYFHYNKLTLYWLDKHCVCVSWDDSNRIKHSVLDTQSESRCQSVLMMSHKHTGGVMCSNAVGFLCFPHRDKSVSGGKRRLPRQRRLCSCRTEQSKNWF